MKKKKIRVKPKKVQANPDEWLVLVNHILAKYKKDMSLLNRLWSQYVKKEKRDFEKEVCKEVIARMDNKKITTEEAQQIAMMSAGKLQDLQKDFPKMLVCLLGGGSMLLCSVVFLFLRAPHSSDPMVWLKDVNVIMWSVLLIINAVVFGIGLKQRKVFTQQLAQHSVLSQASAAYAASKAPGRGGSLFEAHHYLDLIREKNKEAFEKKYGFGKKKK